MQLAFILGRTPDLAYKEVERTISVLPFSGNLTLIQPHLALFSGENIEFKTVSFTNLPDFLSEVETLQNRLGGTIRIAELVGKVLPSDLIPTLSEALIAFTLETKLTFGISVFGGKLDAGKLALSLKTNLKKVGRSVRAVLPKGNELTSAQIIGNSLDGERGVEVILIWDSGAWLIGRTVTVQNIEEYRKRDFEIPVPDPVSGMLSPKLAQTMINLAVGSDNATTIYDPFCGNGRIPEEAALMGSHACGSDILDSQVKASQTNAEWITKTYDLPTTPHFWQADATKAEPPHTNRQSFHIVTEPYLGKPLRVPLESSEEKAWLEELEHLYIKFFTSWSKVSKEQRPQGFLMVFPAAKRRSHPKLLSLYSSLVDRLQQLGYSSSQVSSYGRPDAFIVREIIKLDYIDSQG